MSNVDSYPIATRKGYPIATRKGYPIAIRKGYPIAIRPTPPTPPTPHTHGAGAQKPREELAFRIEIFPKKIVGKAPKKWLSDSPKYDTRTSV